MNFLLKVELWINGFGIGDVMVLVLVMGINFFCILVYVKVYNKLLWIVIGFIVL